MENSLIARPKFNRKKGKWNIAVEMEGEEVKLGNQKKDGITFRYTEFDSKNDAINYIKSDNRLKLKNKYVDLLNKYSRNK